jgi:predicted regulator of Ras-like GTPase activity (Roadblock/LC7/MglB family)
MIKKEKTSEKSAVLLEKEKFYAEEEISPEVKNVLDDIFAEMVSDDATSINPEPITKIAETKTPGKKGNLLNQEVLVEKEKFYAEEDISPEVKSVLDDVFAQMISDDINEISTKNEDIKEVIQEEKPTEKAPSKEEINEKDKKINELSSRVEEYSTKIRNLEEKAIYYKDLIEDFEEKSKTMEASKKQFEERLIELDESRREFEERGKKLEQARESFKQLSQNLEEKRVGLDQREKNLKKMRKELDRIKLRVEQESLDKSIDFESKQDGISEKLNQISQENWDESQLIQMERGKVDILQDILQELLFQGDFQSCFIIDGQGMIISEYSKTELDALAIGAMFSLVCTTVLRTIRSLSLSELEYFKLSSINGEFILRNIDINNYERNFILLAYYHESNSNLPIKKQPLSKKTIRNIVRSIKKDFNESRKNSRLSWVFDNLSDKIDFLKQKYNQFEGDINLIRLNLMNKASSKIRELFER